MYYGYIECWQKSESEQIRSVTDDSIKNGGTTLFSIKFFNIMLSISKYPVLLTEAGERLKCKINVRQC